MARKEYDCALYGNHVFSSNGGCCPGDGGASYGFVVFVYRKRRAVLAHLGKETLEVLCKVSLFPTHVGRSAGESHLGEKI